MALTYIPTVTFLTQDAHSAEPTQLEKNSFKFDYKNVLDSITEGIYAIDTNGICVYCNTACWKMLGFGSGDEFLGQNVHRLIHHNHADGSFYFGKSCKIGKAIKDGVEMIADDEVFWHKSGSAVPVRYHAYPQYSNRELIGAVITFYDISSELLQKRLLQASENKFRNIFENANAGIVYVDQKGYTLSANDAFLNLVGYNLNELRNIEFSSLIVDEDWQMEKVFRNELLNGERESYALEKRYIRKDKKIIWVSINVSKLRETTESPYNFVAVIIDINERKAMEMELKESNKTKNRFISIISHDLRNPVGSLQTLSSFMKDELKPDNISALGQYIDLMAYQSAQSIQLLDNLVEWSKTQQQFRHFQFEELTLLPVIEDVVSGLQAPILNKKLKIEIGCSAYLKILSERNMLHTVLRNLLTNAIKFSYARGLIKIMASEYAGHIKIAVQDHGKGMPLAIQEKLFSEYSPISTSGTNNENGTGFGLLLCAEIIELLGGRIWAESVEGEGSTFFFTQQRS
jgi:PAS domain S-box-containing protein